MVRLLFTALTVVGLAVPGPISKWIVYLRRAGPIELGMTLDQVRRVLGKPKAGFQPHAPVEADVCAYLEHEAAPTGISIMFAGGRVVRVDIDKPGIRTASGAEVGDTESKIESTYKGRISVERHHYLEGGHYLRYSASDAVDKTHGIVFETDGKKVTSYRIGTNAAIALVEGCS
jgi:hypothetical protein